MSLTCKARRSFQGREVEEIHFVVDVEPNTTEDIFVSNTMSWLGGATYPFEK
jgi:hypothetical protein